MFPFSLFVDRYPGPAKVAGFQVCHSGKEPWTAECCGARLSTFDREQHTSTQPCIKKGTAMHTKYTSQALQPIDKTATHCGMKRWQSAVQCRLQLIRPWRNSPHLVLFMPVPPDGGMYISTNEILMTAEMSQH